MYIQYMCAVTFLWFNREVLVLGARQQHASSSHTVHRDLRGARNCASSSLQPWWQFVVASIFLFYV